MKNLDQIINEIREKHTIINSQTYIKELLDNDINDIEYDF